MKLLMWVLLGVLVYWALRSQMTRNQSKFKHPRPRQASRPFQSSAPAEDMVACTYCQIYLPASEAIHIVNSSQVHYFCSEEHAKLHASQSSPE